jgi:glycosyltransferase involved in cell wall biosynthesis
VSRRFLTAPTQPLRPQLQTILFLGRLAPEKNVHLMLAAAEQLPALRFLFGGDGPLRPQVERAASRLGNVEYRGWLNRAEVLAILDEADLLVLPSSVESFGTVALEALARRRLVLVSRHCGIRDWPHLFQCVFVIGEDETVTDAIRRVQRCDYRFRETMAQKGRHAAHDMSDLAVDQWLDIFAELTPDLFQEPKFDLPTHHGPGGDVRPRPDAANVASGV